MSDPVTAPRARSLPLTGERTVPGITEENYWFRRHEVVYTALLPRCRDAVVLEAGCGEGYGADLLAGVARTVLGLDYDAPTAVHAARRYPRVHVARANLVALPLGDAAVDAVVSLQVIEHLWEQGRFLRECLRVLRPGGVLAVSTPNRITFSPAATPRSTRSTPASSPAPSSAGWCARPGSPMSGCRVCTTGRGCGSSMPGTAARSSTPRPPSCSGTGRGPRTCCATSRP